MRTLAADDLRRYVRILSTNDLYRRGMRVPLNLTKDQVFIAVTLGLITGFYNWKSLLVKHLKEETEQINEVIR